MLFCNPFKAPSDKCIYHSCLEHFLPRVPALWGSGVCRSLRADFPTSLAPSPAVPCWPSGKESACNCRRPGFHPWVRKIPWRRETLPTPVFLPRESHGQREPGGLSSMGLQGRRDKKAFLSDQCKEIEENNRMRKTRNLFKKIRDTKGTFHAKMGSKRTEMVRT